jgi:hypothetical protein
MDDTESVKKLIHFSPIQIAAIEAYATDNGLLYGGKPHFAAAVRQIISIGLGVEAELFELKPGNPHTTKKI